MQAFHEFEELHAVHAGHADVGDDQVHGAGLEAFQGLLAAGGPDHAIAGRSQPGVEHLQDMRIIVHHQDVSSLDHGVVHGLVNRWTGLFFSWISRWISSRAWTWRWMIRRTSSSFS
jgi:hypothetical protein